MKNKNKKIQSVLVDCQRGMRETLRVKPLTWGHGPNFGSPGIWVVTIHVLRNLRILIFFHLYQLMKNICY